MLPNVRSLWSHVLGYQFESGRYLEFDDDNITVGTVQIYGPLVADGSCRQLSPVAIGALGLVRGRYAKYVLYLNR